MIPRGFFILLSAGGAAQIITVLALPLLAWFYDPTAFGQLAAVMAIASLTTVLVHGRYQMAIPVSDEPKEAHALLMLASVSSLVLSLPAVLLIYLVAGRQPEGLSIMSLLAAATLVTVFSSLIDVFAYWRSYKGRFKVSAQNNVARSAATALGQMALAASNSAGLVIGTMFGTLVAVVLAIIDFFKNDKSTYKKPSFKQVREVAVKYRSYPLFGVPQGWFAALSWNAMPLLLLRFGGTALAGQYWLAYRLLVAPVSLFNGAYRQATLPVLGQIDGTASRRLITKHTGLIAGLSVLPVVVLFFFGEALFSAILGEKWLLAGTIAGWLAVGVLADVSKVPTLCLLQSQSKQKRILAWEMSILLIRYAVALWYFLSDQIIEAVAAFAVIGLVGWFLFCVFECLLISNKSYKGQEK